MKENTTKIVYLLEGKFEDFSKILEEALSIAEHHPLTAMITSIKQERETLSKQPGKWQHLIQSNASIVEKMEYAELSDYIEKAKKLIPTIKYN